MRKTAYEPLTKEERAAIAVLRRLERRWPRSLWLFSAAGILSVMKKNADGEVVYGNGERDSRIQDGGVNSDYLVTEIDIENDGGDW